MRVPIRAEINAGPLGRGGGVRPAPARLPFRAAAVRGRARRASPVALVARLLWLAWLVGQPTPARLVRLT